MMMSNDEDQLEVAARLLRTSPDALNCRPLPDDNATYYWVAARGGGAIILGRDRSALFANSSVSPEAHLKAFRAGRRTPPDQFE